VTADATAWAAVAPAVAGRLVSAYCRTDWVLALLCRTLSLETKCVGPPAHIPCTSAFPNRWLGRAPRVAGIAPVDCAYVENVDVTDLVRTLCSCGRPLR
jgi:hypothetical protein